MTDQINVSVVTINLNRKAGLEKTLASLARQRQPAFELIVVDGGSNDGSLDVCSKYSAIISRLIVEADAGIFDAWNKGIKASSGRIVGLLNAGDEYHADVISVIDKYVSDVATGACRQILCGYTLMVDNGRVMSRLGNRRANSVKLGLGASHPSTFVFRSVYEEIGLYEDISIAADAQFLLRCVKRGIAFIPSEHRVYMEATGLSQSAASTGFSQYTAALRQLNFCGPFQARLIRATFAIYKHRETIARIFMARAITENSRNLLIRLMNIGQRVALGGPIRRLILRLLKFDIDRSAFVSPFTTWYAVGNFSVGADSVIKRNATIDNRDKISIGHGCSIGASVLLTTADNDIDSPYFEYSSRAITIGNFVVILDRAAILAGTRLEDGVMVLPGSVVAGTTVRNGIYGGVPATFIRLRESEPVHRFSNPRPFAL